MGEYKSGNPADMLTNAWQAAARLGDIQLDICNKLAQTQNDLMALWIEYGTRQMQIFNGHRDPAECAALESDLITEYSPKLYEQTAKVFDIFKSATSDLVTQLNGQLASTAATQGDEAKKHRKVTKIPKPPAAA
ncbi:MAG TPA: phasin family protein [Gammaproteobacteria bacterium]|nr:phasin family protein [Gammaproteobacteria bacterium]